MAKRVSKESVGWIATAYEIHVGMVGFVIFWDETNTWSAEALEYVKAAHRYEPIDGMLWEFPTEAAARAHAEEWLLAQAAAIIAGVGRKA